jgi:hypothetical protein
MKQILGQLSGTNEDPHSCATLALVRNRSWHCESLRALQSALFCIALFFALLVSPQPKMSSCRVFPLEARRKLLVFPMIVIGSLFAVVKRISANTTVGCRTTITLHLLSQSPLTTFVSRNDDGLLTRGVKLGSKSRVAHMC